ncbi:MAG: D-aminoacyl-tRNA deacylase [Chloroflexota bacterium]|nr:D-aminoacyl-tRNA deacylase [Chloroflexota bacterium]MDE2685267.1 D-aminoacyl-tRNA deacylase [Chloroflexota bacterium]
MRALIQRVTEASVSIDDPKAGRIDAGSIGTGLVVLLGVGEGDDDADAQYLVDKITNMRIFADQQGRFNLSALDVGGELLVVSQFTLYADTRRGRRPDFNAAAGLGEANRLYERAVAMFREKGLRVATGRFQAYMQVQLVNDGPVTIMVDSADRGRPRNS